MKLSQLLLQRDALLRQALLANLAQAYVQLEALVTRLDRAQLSGAACLEPADPEAGQYWPTLTALEGSQAVIEEHFADSHIAELADLVAFLTGRPDEETTFRLEDMAVIFLAPLRDKLLRAGVEFDPALPAPAAPEQSDSSVR
jgi:hypothetical protein